MIKETGLDLHDPIVALATPWGESAIGVIRTSGKGSIKKIASIFKGKSKIQKKESHTLSHGRLVDPGNGELVDEVLVALYRAPHSYTGEEAVEIFCHGSPVSLKKALSLLYKIGFRQANPGEFTLRAFLNGKMDLTRAEAVNELVRARSDKARRLALHRLGGGIEKIITSFKTRLVDFLSRVEVMLDYPDEEQEHGELGPDVLTALKKEAGDLLATYGTGRIYQEGAVVALAGCTNSGKSTLFNLLLQEERAIVSELHGTTRDFIEGAITLGDIPIRLYDTAGLRSTDHPVEAEGIRRTAKIIDQADLVVYLIDGSQGISQEDEAFWDGMTAGAKLVKVWNKCDLGRGAAPQGVLPLCALDGRGLPGLEEKLVQLLLGQAPLETDSPVIDSLRQKECLEQTLSALARAEQACLNKVSLDLLAEDLRQALNALGGITGEVTSEDLLQAMFAKFCVGK